MRTYFIGYSIISSVSYDLKIKFFETDIGVNNEKINIKYTNV